VSHADAEQNFMAEVRALIDRARTIDAPHDALLAAAAAIEKVNAELDPYVYEGPYQQSQLRGQGGVETLEGTDPHAFFPYSPVVGEKNPIAPPVRMWFDGERMHGAMTLGAPYTGPPSMVHGGIIALIFDELLGALTVARQLGGFTGTLSVRYVAPTPLQTPLVLEGWVERVDGRKAFTVGEMRHGNVVTARADGLFIRSAP
jgi:acyl-coenzyme A thioesterase PaaI-like protein